MKEIHINDLTRPTITRSRGRSAYEALVDVMQEDEIDVLLDGAGALSLSFLDGFVLCLQKAAALNLVTFVTGEPAVRRKLERLAGIHPELSVYLRDSTRSPRRAVNPRPPVNESFLPEDKPQE